jgi:hypothetical protein
MNKLSAIKAAKILENPNLFAAIWLILSVVAALKQYYN